MKTFERRRLPLAITILTSINVITGTVITGALTNGAFAKENKTKPATVSSPTATSPTATSTAPLAADAALTALKQGNQRFVKEEIRNGGNSKSDVQRLASGQAPSSIVLSCSDSRVPPETVFDQKLGEVFAVRTAGETLSPQAIASIEFAIAKLGSHLVVVLGHTNCGAVKASVETIKGGDAGSPSLNQLVSDIHPNIRSVLQAEGPSKDLEQESWANAIGIARALPLKSKIIGEAVKAGKVKVAVGLYNLATGNVQFKDLIGEGN